MALGNFFETSLFNIEEHEILSFFGIKFYTHPLWLWIKV